MPKKIPVYEKMLATFCELRGDGFPTPYIAELFYGEDSRTTRKRVAAQIAKILQKCGVAMKSHYTDTDKFGTYYLDDIEFVKAMDYLLGKFSGKEVFPANPNFVAWYEKKKKQEVRTQKWRDFLKKLFG